MSEHGKRRLDVLAQDIHDCRRCHRHQGRQNVVVGSGGDQARVMFIGEMPGRTEDRNGEAFSGDSGKLLDQLLKDLGWKREFVYATRMLKCHHDERGKKKSPGLSAQLPGTGWVREGALKHQYGSTSAVEQCQKYLMEEITIVNPEVVVMLGRGVAQALLHTDERIEALRGSWSTLETSEKVYRAMTTYSLEHVRRPDSPTDEMIEIVKNDLRSVHSALA
jgi:DNA polymerase